MEVLNYLFGGAVAVVVASLAVARRRRDRARAAEQAAVPGPTGHATGKKAGGQR